jgi:hypothetical protein
MIRSNAVSGSSAIKPTGRLVPVVLAMWWMLPGLVTTSVAAVEDMPQSDRAVDEALGDSAWYDADLGELIPVHVQPVVDDSLNRDSRWLPKAKRIQQPETTPPQTTTGGGGTGGGLFGSSLTIGNLFGWLLLLAIVAATAGTIIYALSKTEVDLTSKARSKSRKPSTTPDEQTIERMKHLPAELRRTDVNLRSEAERLMNAGQYDQAIILLFGHQLLLLDRVGMLRLNRGKTNRKYVRESRTADPETAGRLQQTVNAFERSYFGRHVLSQREFSELWRSNLKLEQAVEAGREAAA